jgi:DNA-binding transcriptional LysR family regulator
VNSTSSPFVTPTEADQMLNAAMNGAGLAFIPEDLARPYVESGQLKWVLEEWLPTFPGLHIYYPIRR